MTAFGLALALSAVVGSASADPGVIDVHGSGGALVPVEGTGTVPVGALGVALGISEVHSLGLRLLGAPPSDTAAGTTSWGTVVELRRTVDLVGRLRPIGVVSGGFVAATPPGPDTPNLVRPALHAGVGFELVGGLSQSSWTLAPVLGVAPQLFTNDRLLSVYAPTVELRIGGRWPPLE